jgi:fibronectin-binding autotransporter adhesin
VKIARKQRGFLILAAVIAVGLAVFVAPRTASAANPGTISFQGKVVNANGTNVTDGTYNILFKIYNASSAGTVLWSETDSVVVTSGVFQVNLGLVNTALSTIDYNANPALYLGITFASDAAEMSPRPQLQSVPFAFNSDKLGGLDKTGFLQVAPASAQADATTNTSIFLNKSGVSGNLIQLQTGGGTPVNKFTVSFAGDVTAGNYNTNVFNGNTLTFGSSSTATIQSAASQALNLTGHAASTWDVGGTLSLQTSSNGAITTGTGLFTQGGDVTFNGTTLRTITGPTTGGLKINDTGGPLTLSTTTSGTLTLSSAGALNVSAAAASTINTGSNTLAVSSLNYNVDASGNQTAAFTNQNTATTANGGSGLTTSTSLVVTTVTGYINGNYVGVADAGTCTLTGVCYAKITAIVGNTLTITPALKWSTGAAVNQYKIPEIGGTDTAQTLTNRYGRGYFIAGVATGNGTTYYSEDGISSSLSTYNLLNTGVTTLNIGGAATAIAIGSSGTTTTVAGSLSTSGGGAVSTTGALQGGTLSINSGAFAVDATGAITAGTIAGARVTGTVGTANGGTGLTTYTTNGILYASNASTVAQLTGSGSAIQFLSSNNGAPSFVTFAGDGTLSAAGALTIGTGAITGTKIANSTLTSANFNSATTYSNITSVGTLSALTLSGVITGATTINGATISGGTLSATSVSGAGAFTVASGASSDLSFTSGSNKITLGTIATFQTTNTSQTFDLNGAGANIFTVRNAGAGTADLKINNGGLYLGNSQVLTSGSVLQNVTIGVSQLSGTIASGNISGGYIGITSVGTLGTLSVTGAITGATSTNTINGIVINSGAVSSVTTLNTSGLITGALGITITGASSSFAGVTNSSTYNGNTFTGAALTFSTASANTITGAASQSLTVSSGTSGQLILNSASGTLGIASTTTTIQRTATGSLTLDLNDSGTTTLIVKNSGSGVANLNLFGGSLTTGSAPVTRIDNSGNFTANTLNLTAGSNQILVGGTAVTSFTCGANTYVNTAVVTAGLITGHSACTGVGLSDQRVKKDIVSLDNSSLDKIARVNPVTFYYDCNNSYFNESNTTCETSLQTGVVAQQLIQIFPDLVRQDELGYYHVDYQGLSVEAVKAVGEIARHIDSAGNGTFNNLTVDGTLTYNSTQTNNGSFTTSIISPLLTSNGALTLDSGSTGDVIIDTGGANNYVTVGATNAAGVNVSKAGQTTTVAGALVIDQAATFHGKVTIDSTEADGLLSTRNFSVNGAGDVNTKGSFISRGGGLQMLDAAGNPLFTIDTSGNGVLTGSLNLASASISGGLTVGGDINVAGLSTFQKLATFMAKTIFKQDVQFEGHITVAADSAGYASLRATESTVHVKFVTAYDGVPVVSTNSVDGQFIQTSVKNIAKDGFDITVATPVTGDTKFSWTAIGVKDPLTASNPLPSSPPPTTPPTP